MGSRCQIACRRRSAEPFNDERAVILFLARWVQAVLPRGHRSDKLSNVGGCLDLVSVKKNRDFLSHQTRAFPQFAQKTAFGGIAMPQNLQLVSCVNMRGTSNLGTESYRILEGSILPNPLFHHPFGENATHVHASIYLKHLGSCSRN